ncbi:hypothetical protein [Streptomyces sp. NPDC059455]|uniref:hypothetical protein n=1 Tax=Streptomyces sp. NPDC059455 TaxID=3346837 RepID=UPI0036C5D87C
MQGPRGCDGQDQSRAPEDGHEPAARHSAHPAQPDAAGLPILPDSEQKVFADYRRTNAAPVARLPEHHFQVGSNGGLDLDWLLRHAPDDMRAVVIGAGFSGGSGLRARGPDLEPPERVAERGGSRGSAAVRQFSASPETWMS